MRFGKYRGLPLQGLPDDYLEWLHGLDDLRGRLRNRPLALKYHSDKTGPTDTMQRLNRLIERLRQEMVV